MIDSYGAAIEYDLFDHGGWDLLDWFRGLHPWPQLFRIVDQLPALSRYRRAIADDDDLAREALALSLGIPGTVSRLPSLDGWTEADELRATLLDGFHLIQHALIAVNTPKGKPPPKFNPTPRPRTATQRAELARRKAEHADMVAKLVPKAGGT